MRVKNRSTEEPREITCMAITWRLLEIYGKDEMRSMGNMIDWLVEQERERRCADLYQKSVAREEALKNKE